MSRLDEELRTVVGWAKHAGVDIGLHLRRDGRVTVTAGSKTVHADLLLGGPLPEPTAAIEELLLGRSNDD